MSGEERELELYPSNWLYNAGVIGFLRVLEKGMKNKKEKENDKEKEKEKFDDKLKIFFKNNCFSLPKEAFKKKTISIEDGLKAEIYQIWEWYFSAIGELKQKNDNPNSKNNESKEIEKISPIRKNWGYVFNQFFRGLFNAGLFGKQKMSKDKKKGEIKKINKLLSFATNKTQGEGDNEIFTCSICGEKFRKDDNFEKFYTFSSQHIKLLGSSPTADKGMPNSFWNLNASMPICLTCTYMILHYPLAFTQTSDGDEIFINAPDFRLMWYLNKFVREVLEKEGTKDIRKLFGLSLMQWAMRINQTLGSWTMANIEVIRKKGNIIDHFDLPPDVVSVLMDPVAASLITSLHLWPILELVMRGKYSELLVATHCAAKAYLVEKDIPDNHCVEKYGGNKDKKRTGKMFKKLPWLFARIKEIKEDKMGEEKTKDEKVRAVYYAGVNSRGLKDNFKNLSFRILELTRLGRVNDAYQAIARVFIASNTPIPSDLVNILSEDDQELQKSYIYAFLSGVLGEEKEQGGE